MQQDFTAAVCHYRFKCFGHDLAQAAQAVCLSMNSTMQQQSAIKAARKQLMEVIQLASTCAKQQKFQPLNTLATANWAKCSAVCVTLLQQAAAAHTVAGLIPRSCSSTQVLTTYACQQSYLRLSQTAKAQLVQLFKFRR